MDRQQSSPKAPGLGLNALISPLEPVLDLITVTVYNEDDVHFHPISQALRSYSGKTRAGQQRTQAIAQGRETVLAQGLGDAPEPGASSLIRVSLKGFTLILL